ncbi:MAG: phospholipase D-like domain-containing protein [Streptococcus sp.]
MKFAAERGVDVSIIMPGIPDKKSAYYSQDLLPNTFGIRRKIYEYTPGFVHAKVFVSDNSRAVVGTINLDYRSLYHHFECATYLYRTSSVVGIEEDFQATMASVIESA